MNAWADTLPLVQVALLVATGLAVFVAPGALVLRAAGAALRPFEVPAFCFAGSLALLVVTFAVCLGLGTGIPAAPAVLALLTAATGAAAFALCPKEDRARPASAAAATPPKPDDSSITDGAGRGEPGGEVRSSPRLTTLVLVLVTTAFVVAAVSFAPVGSLDRWWYLAYVRSYLDAPVLSIAEPFLGTGESFARFGLHPWLFGLALWSWLSGVDPLLVYERAAPVLVVLVAVSASLAMMRSLFGDGPRARLGLLASMLLWSGGLVPLLARAGEDKILAAAALVPVCAAAFLRVADRGGDSREGLARSRGSLLLLALAAAATAWVHALVYALVLLALVPTALVLAVVLPARRRAMGLACAVLLILAVAPASSGLVVSRHLGEIGAASTERDHPVVRVHEGRDRTVDLPVLGPVTHPRLLAHPLTLLALAGLVLVLGNLRRTRGCGEETAELVDARSELTMPAAVFLVTTTTVALSVAFLPPLPTLAGHVVPPWMVYRVLWLLPLGALAAVAALGLVRPRGGRESVALLVILALGLPGLVEGTRERRKESRERLALPADPALGGLLEATAALPRDAMLVAAPELAERLPALTSRAVVAGLDRSTIVFSGSRRDGEARLRARAALLVGDADGPRLARGAGVSPTHAIFDPHWPQTPRCGEELYRREGYALCRLVSNGGNPSSEELQESSGAAGGEAVAGHCAEAAIRREPWSARPTTTSCRIPVSDSWRGRSGLRLRLETSTGRAADELRVVVRSSQAGDDVGRATVKTTGTSTTLLDLPPLDTDSIEVRVTSSFLPSLRIRRIALVGPRGDR